MLCLLADFVSIARIPFCFQLVLFLLRIPYNQNIVRKILHLFYDYTIKKTADGLSRWFRNESETN